MTYDSIFPRGNLRGIKSCIIQKLSQIGIKTNFRFGIGVKNCYVRKSNDIFNVIIANNDQFLISLFSFQERARDGTFLIRIIF